jgi:hypothetical protein
MPASDFESGELIITGEDTVEIHLRDIPHHVECHFKKVPAPPPCDPHHHHHHHHDKLEWEVQKTSHHHHYKYRLIISWKVAGVREILWLANF